MALYLWMLHPWIKLITDKYSEGLEVWPKW
jgi:hypothetical protein